MSNAARTRQHATTKPDAPSSRVTPRVRHLHVVLGDQTIQSYRYSDYSYYVQALLERYRAAVAQEIGRAHV